MKIFKNAILIFIFIIISLQIIQHTYINEPLSWIYDSWTFDGRKANEQDGRDAIYIRFYNDNNVLLFVDGRQLTTTEYQKYRRLLAGNHKIDVVITGYQLKPVIKYVTSLQFSFAVFLLFLTAALWLDRRQEQSNVPQKNGNATHFTMLAFCICVPLLCVIDSLVPQTFVRGDGYGYLSYVKDFDLLTIMGSDRTPGYSLFLKFALMFSPISYSFVSSCQHFIFLFSLSWLLWECFSLRIHALVCMLAFLLFYGYLYQFHSMMLCESLELSGVNLLLASSIHFCLAWDRNNSFINKCIWGGLIGIICFANLMIKPFPVTIFLPSLVVFFYFLFKKNMKIMNTLIVCCIIGVINLLPAMGFCLTRYILYGDFNFASILNVISTACAVSATTKEKIAQADISAEQRALLDDFLTFYIKKRAHQDWPLNESISPSQAEKIHAKTRMNMLYREYGMYVFFVNKIKAMPDSPEKKFASLYPRVYAHNQCAGIASAIFTEIQKDDLFNKLRQYHNDLYWNCLTQKPQWVPKFFNEFSPFSSWRNFIVLFIIPMFIATIKSFSFKKYPRFNILWDWIAKDLRPNVYWNLTGVAIALFCGTALLNFIFFRNELIIEFRSEMVTFYPWYMLVFISGLYAICTMIQSFFNTLSNFVFRHKSQKIFQDPQ